MTRKSMSSSWPRDMHVRSGLQPTLATACWQGRQSSPHRSESVWLHLQAAMRLSDNAARIKRVREGKELLQTMSRQTSECGMLPEQVWDADDIPERELFNGKPSGSGMPLVWAHAEYIKLLRSLHEGAVWDMPPQTFARYVEQRQTAVVAIWRPAQRRRYLPAGRDLRVDLDTPPRVRWSWAGDECH